MESKTCTKCHRDLPLDEFYVDRGKPRNRCKRCHIDKVAETAAARLERKRQERVAIAEAGVYIQVFEKRCRDCKLTKSIDEFYNNKGEKDGKQRACKKCQNDSQRSRRQAINERARDNRAKDPEKYRQKSRKYHPLKRYKLTLDQFDAMFASQNGRCAGCGADDHGGTNWHVDHDHACCGDGVKETCGACVKAILCYRCNVTAGWFEDDPVILRSLADYITKTRNITEGGNQWPSTEPLKR